jgi:hypothetical protein
MTGGFLGINKEGNVRMLLTGEASRLLKRYVDLGGIPSTVIAVKKEGRLADCGGERSVVVCILWV